MPLLVGSHWVFVNLNIWLFRLFLDIFVPAETDNGIHVEENPSHRR